MSRLNKPIKGQRLTENIKKQDPTTHTLETNVMEIKTWKRCTMPTGIKKKARLAIPQNRLWKKTNRQKQYYGLREVL